MSHSEDHDQRTAILERGSDTSDDPGVRGARDRPGEPRLRCTRVADRRLRQRRDAVVGTTVRPGRVHRGAAARGRRSRPDSSRRTAVADGGGGRSLMDERGRSSNTTTATTATSPRCSAVSPARSRGSRSRSSAGRQPTTSNGNATPCTSARTWRRPMRRWSNCSTTPNGRTRGVDDREHACRLVPGVHLRAAHGRHREQPELRNERRRPSPGRRLTGVIDAHASPADAVTHLR